jgi:TonB family protein
MERQVGFSTEGASVTPFCNLDSVVARPDFGLTLIDQATLVTRLSDEVKFFATQAKNEWPAFKADAFGYAHVRVVEFCSAVAQRLRTPNTSAGAIAAVSIVISVMLCVLVLDRRAAKNNSSLPLDEPTYASVINFQTLMPGSSLGFSATVNGRVGLNDGKGEGSKPEPKKAHGGGGGGDHSLIPAQQGAVPQPSEIQAPIQTPNKNPALPVAGVNLDPALWKALPFAQYGDPRSASQVSANGPGSGGGMGEGQGQGIGEGTGSGLGRGNNGNTGDGSDEIGGGGIGSGAGGGLYGSDRVLSIRQVEQRARVLSKPEPQYTDEARRNQITGTVTLRVVFSRFGEVTNIRAIQSLPLGLTERAIAAARQIRFVPAMLNGQPVSVYMQLEYNFNLY